MPVEYGIRSIAYKTKSTVQTSSIFQCDLLTWRLSIEVIFLISTSPCNGATTRLIGGQWKWISISQCVGQVPGHHVPNCPQEERPGNMKQSFGKAPTLEDALTDCPSILSHWHKCNRMKPFILAGELEVSQWKMTNAFYIKTYVYFKTIYILASRTSYMFSAYKYEWRGLMEQHYVIKRYEFLANNVIPRKWDQGWSHNQT